MRDVRAAFGRIADRDERLGVRRGRLPSNIYDSLDPHLQGIQRIPNTNIVYISGSEKPQLLIAELRSRPRRGRLRSNRITSNLPPSTDTIVSTRVLHRTWHHAGGFQVAGSYLAIGLESDGRSQVQIWDVSDPLSPSGPVARIPRSFGPAGAVALVRDGSSWLLIVGRSDSNILDFYRGPSPTELELVDTWYESQLTGMDREFGNYQNINLVRQSDGALFLIGLHRNDKIGLGDDWIDLFTVRFTSTGRAMINKIANKHLTAHGDVSLDNGGGVYVDGDDLIVYGTTNKQRSGFIELSEFRSVPTRLSRPLTSLADSWVEFYDDHDFRDRRALIDHRDRGLRNYSNFASFSDIGGFGDKASAVRWLLPSGWQYLAFEHTNCKGRLLRLEGTGQPRSIRDLGRSGWGDKISSGRFARTVVTNTRDGWVELFDDDGFRDRRLEIRGYGASKAIRDYKKITVEGKRGFGDKVSSVRWQLPRGVTYRLYQHDSYRGRTLSLTGTGRIREISNLDSHRFGDEVSSSRYV